MATERYIRAWTVHQARGAAQGTGRLTSGIANVYPTEEPGQARSGRRGRTQGLGPRPAGWPPKAAGPGDLDAVLLTHAHTDHTAFAEPPAAVAAGSGASAKAPVVDIPTY
jgi:glyoxylase-like metal-dependent hydrolase (beta-lactamase superfamily II)